MKKYLLLLLMTIVSLNIVRGQVLIATLIVAGKNNDRIDTGLKIAANYSYLSLSPSNVLDNTSDPKFSLNFGVTFDYALTKAKTVYLMSGVELSGKGTRIDEGKTEGIDKFRFLQQSTLVSLGSLPQKAKFSMRYIQIPIHIGYKYALKRKDMRLVFRGGAYVAYATNGYLQDDDIKLNVFGELAKQNDIHVNRFDTGIGAALGAEFGKIKATFGYDLGLLDIDKTAGTVKNRVGYLALGYQF